jgi:hypothetical protein
MTISDGDTCPDAADNLDEESFRHFAPLLRASQEYSRHSGFRFRSASFHSVSDNHCFEEVAKTDAASSQAKNPLLAAKLRAAPAVRSFAERLRAGEPALVEELERAFRLVMAESVRNSMIGTCKELGVFPPSPPPSNVTGDDCAFEDASEPLPVIAQRLFNDQVRRDGVGDETGTISSESGALGCRLLRRAMTAAYLVDFASETGATLPQMPETYRAMFQEFAARASEWARLTRGGGSKALTQQDRQQALQNGVMGFGASAEKSMREELSRWWSWTEQKENGFWATANMMVLGSAHGGILQCVGVGRRTAER